MDYARKIGKNEVPFPWKKSPSPPSSISDKLLIEDDEIIEDKRLKNWRKWLADRKRHCQHYGKKNQRDYENLLINTPEKFRQRVETTNFINRVGGVLEKKIDKYRGDPGFWITPEFLPKHGNPNLPDISITVTEKQRKFEPENERVALPRLIQEEKGIFLDNDQKTFAKRREYLKTVTKLSSSKIKLLEAKEPEVDLLFVKGQRLGEPKLEVPKIPIITITAAENFESPTKCIRESDDIILKIQNRIVKFEEKSDENIDQFALIFKSTDLNAVEGNIRLENLGNCTITYRWRYHSLGSNLLPSTSRSSPFFFNKNKDILLPGQIVILRVWFRSRVPCVVTEFWTLLTDPKVSCMPLIFRFWGCYSPVSSFTIGETNRDSNVENSIDQYLDRRIRDNEINGIINEILENVGRKTFPLPAYQSLFVESEIFQAKNPLYFYHPQLIRELRNIYNEVASEDSPDWSLSLNDLREILLQIEEPQMRNEALLKFNELCRDCLVPSFYNSNGNCKKSMVYNLLCSFINEFETEIDCVRKKCFREENESEIRKGNHEDARNVSKTSQTNSTPRRKSRKSNRSGQLIVSRITSKTSVSSISSSKSVESSVKLKSPIKKESECLLYKEIFYVRIREKLVNTISNICGIFESVNNLNGQEKLIDDYR